MNWMEFFKPSIWKLLLALVLPVWFASILYAVWDLLFVGFVAPSLSPFTWIPYLVPLILYVLLFGLFTLVMALSGWSMGWEGYGSSALSLLVAFAVNYVIACAVIFYYKNRKEKK